MRNLYFDLTEEFNAERPIALLASGQAVVYYRLAMMSKDGDWILRESPACCARVLAVLAGRGARYRPGAPLDVRWLAGGWSSHFELFDAAGRRVRCDFFTRPPRIPLDWLDRRFSAAEQAGTGLLVVDVEPLIRMKQTQRAKDYPVIAELARLLPPAQEIELTTDPDRILVLAKGAGGASRRPSVRAALAGEGRDAVVVALAREIDELRRQDHDRVERFQRSAEPYLRAFRAAELDDLPLAQAHERLCELAALHLPRETPA
jgi:hypothetical protein